jgi:phosphate starvation-inducible membrane PsiE
MNKKSLVRSVDILLAAAALLVLVIGVMTLKTEIFLNSF